VRPKRRFDARDTSVVQPFVRKHLGGPPHTPAVAARNGSVNRVAARSANTPDSTTGNLGFRCARAA
jgi:hypothetical protein